MVLGGALPRARRGAGGADVFGRQPGRRPGRGATYDQTLPFYWRRTVSLVAYRGELDYGLRHDPGAGIDTIDAFLPVWLAQTDAFAVMETDMFDRLQQRGMPMHEIARDLHRVLVAR